MADQSTTLPTVVTHGAARLPSVDVDSYNVELKDDEGLLGDRASKGAFTAILERWRKPLRKAGDDPFGDEARTSAARSSTRCSQRATTWRPPASCRERSRTLRRSSR